MDGTSRLGLMWGKIGVAVITAVLGLGLGAVPAQAATPHNQTVDMQGQGGAIANPEATVVSMKDLPAANRVDLITGTSLNSTYGASSGVHPMLMVIAVLLAGFAVAIGALLFLPGLRRRRPAALYVSGVDHRHLCLEVRDPARLRHLRSLTR